MDRANSICNGTANAEDTVRNIDNNNYADDNADYSNTVDDNSDNIV